MKRIFGLSALAISVIAFVLFTLLWWWRNNMPYNEAGRYYDGFVVWHEQGVILYASFSIVSFVSVVTMGYVVWRGRNAGTW